MIIFARSSFGRIELSTESDDESSVRSHAFGIQHEEFFSYKILTMLLHARIQTVWRAVHPGL